jgi:hypothetical protein
MLCYIYRVIDQINAVIVTCVRHVMEAVKYLHVPAPILALLRGLEGKSYFVMDLFCLERTYN